MSSESIDVDELKKITQNAVLRIHEERIKSLDAEIMNIREIVTPNVAKNVKQTVNEAAAKGTFECVLMTLIPKPYSNLSDGMGIARNGFNVTIHNCHIYKRWETILDEFDAEDEMTRMKMYLDKYQIGVGLKYRVEKSNENIKLYADWRD